MSDKDKVTSQYRLLHEERRSQQHAIENCTTKERDSSDIYLLSFHHSIIGQSGSRSQTLSSAVDYCKYYLGDICQQEKLLGPGYELRPECELLHTEQVELNALTCVDTQRLI